MSNPIIPGKGVCDPHILIFNDTAYLYASHDKSPDNKEFVMEDWWIWSSKDLVNWKHECTLKPEETYMGEERFRNSFTVCSGASCILTSPAVAKVTALVKRCKTVLPPERSVMRTAWGVVRWFLQGRAVGATEPQVCINLPFVPG